MAKNLLIAQSGGPTAAINSSVCGIIVEAMERDNIGGIYGAINGILGILNEELVDLRQEDRLTILNLRKTPSAALGSCRYKLSERDYTKLMEVFAAHNISYFLYAGGNDSMDTAHKVAQLAAERNYDLHVMGVPKTIDNDLMVTDHCPGYGSVARFNAIAVRDSGLDTEAIYTTDTVKIIETMGRDTGWITASTALGKDGLDSAPHLIYLPERPFVSEKFLEDVKSVYDRLGRVVICVCEGLKNEKGEFVKASTKKMDTDKFGHSQLGGVADYLVNLSKAVDGETDKMVTLVRKGSALYECETGLVELEKVALRTKKVPNEFISKDSNFISKEFLEYAKPLIGGPLPEYAHLKKKMIEKHT